MTAEGGISSVGTLGGRQRMLIVSESAVYDIGCVRFWTDPEPAGHLRLAGG